jgi:DNA-binding transcriptional MerR regulator
MLAQLDLFTPAADEGRKPDSNRGRLTPPEVILMEDINEIPEPKVTLKPFSAAEPVTEPVEQKVQAEESTGTPPAKKDDTPVTGKSNRGRKSIREMSRDAALVEIPPDEQLFSKQYYGIGEVATMFNVNASLLRFWESEFDILKPRKNKKGDRFFRPEDIKNLQQIHHLLRERKYTIEGAREFIKKSGRRQQQFEAIESLKKIRAFLLELKTGL